MKIRKRVLRIVILVVLLIIGVGTALFLKEFFFSNDEKVIYGTRLKGIEKNKISNETKENAKASIKEEVSNVEIRIAGKIVYITIKVKEGTTLDVAKALGAKPLEAFSAEEKSYYDFQVMIDCETENPQFPIIGYKQHSRETITWTKDRVS